MRYVAVDLETRGKFPYRQVIWSITLFEVGKKPQVWHDCSGLKKCPAEAKKVLEDERICKIIHNAEFDGPMIELNWGVKVRNIWDSMLAETVIQGVELPPIKKKDRTPEQVKLYEQYGTALDIVLRRYKLLVPQKVVRENFIDRPLALPFTKTELQYMVDDVVPLPALQRAQEFLLRRDSLLEVALLENKFIEKIITAKVLGIGVNKVRWFEVADQNLQRYNRHIRSLPKEVKNWNSTKQVCAFFTARGTTLTTFKDLETVYIRTRDPLLGRFIKIRQMYSDTTLYGKQWLYRKDGTLTIDGDGRIRTNYIPIKNTGRIATNNPNVLALPKEGNQRSCIVPRKGHVFVIGDFGGQEMGIMASLAKERLLLDAMLRGEDPHALIASIITPAEWSRGTVRGCTFPKKCKCPEHIKLREPAKTNNFLIPYGGGGDKLLMNMIESLFERTPGVPTNEQLENLMTQFQARVFVKKHKRAVRRLADYLDANAREAVRTQVSYSGDPYRRRRVLRGQQRWQIENQGRNNPIQGAGANMIKLASISMPEEFPLILFFHDELLAEVPTKVAKKCVVVMKEIMEQAADYITGVKGLIKVEPRIATDFTKK